MTLYVTDLDGTLLRSDTTISDESVQTLNRLIGDGTLFTYATARSYSSAHPLVKDLKLSCPAVTFNGVFVIDPRTGEHIAENIFTPKSLDIAKDFFITNRLNPLVYSYIGGRERVSYIVSDIDAVRGYVENRASDPRLRPVETYSELFEGKIFYFTLLNPPISYDILDGVFCNENGFSRNLQPDTYEPYEMWYEIFSKNASKASAVLQVLELTRADRLVCFGDNSNDVSMLRAADTGVAVANASEDAKQAADEVTGSCDDGAVARYISSHEEHLDDTDRFSAALSAAMTRIRGMHGSVGTQNEKLIHAVLKNYYAPYADEQEIKLGKFFADAVSEDGIFEIQTRSLHLLKEKLAAFTAAARVTVVHPVIVQSRNVFVRGDTGEVYSETPFRRFNRRVKIFEELYSIRDFLANERLTVILAELKAEKRVVFSGETPPDMRSKSARKKADIQKIPLALLKEIRLETPEDYRIYLPDGLPGQFTKKEFLKICRDPAGSLRLEVLRAVGLIGQVGVKGRQYVYSLTE